MYLHWNGLSESPYSFGDELILTVRFISRILPLGVIALAEKLLHMNRHARPSAAEAMEDSYFSSEPLPSSLEYVLFRYCYIVLFTHPYTA